MNYRVIYNTNSNISWKSKFHDDGTMLEGYFNVGIDTENGK